jgi:UMF1 family MFS transporter
MMLAAFGFYSSLVFYNSYLPEIAEEKDRDRISAKGFSFGYIGSVIMQIIGFLLVVFWDKIPFLESEGHAVRFTFLLVGIWWFGFCSKFHFAGCRQEMQFQQEAIKTKPGKSSFLELKKVWSQLMKMPVLKRFYLHFSFTIWVCKR